jgi:transporter family protein
LQAILGKVGITHIDSNLGTAVRTVVVLVVSWIIVFMQGKQKEIKGIDKKSWIFLVLSGFATGLSWLCYYRALQDGPASVVVPIDKLSILVTVALSYIIFKERLTKKSIGGLGLIVIGTLCLLINA